MAKRCCRKHPFFCEGKGCRKSAWETPDCLSAADWSLIREIRHASTSETFTKIVYRDSKTTDAFFNRVIGWPEGEHYMRDEGYALATGWPALTRADGPLARAISALEERTQRTVVAERAA